MLTNVVAGIITKNEKVYIFQRGGNSYKGLYEFPGGKVEKNETLSKALARELNEELTIKTRTVTKICNCKSKEINLHTFIVNDYEGQITLTEHTDYKLVNQDEINNYPLVGIDKEVLNICFKEEYLIMDTILGHIKITGNYINITSIKFTDEPLKETTINLLLVAKEQLNEYFNKTRTLFSLPLYIKGTNFQKEIWEKTIKIPYGQTRIYGELSKGARAVGSALGYNQHLIVIPCHRVIGKNNLGGYSGGIKIKEQLLEMENLGNKILKSILGSF